MGCSKKTASAGRGSLAGIDLVENTHYGHNKHMTDYIYVWKEQIHK